MLISDTEETSQITTGYIAVGDILKTPKQGIYRIILAGEQSTCPLPIKMMALIKQARDTALFLKTASSFLFCFFLQDSPDCASKDQKVTLSVSP